MFLPSTTAAAGRALWLGGFCAGGARFFLRARDRFAMADAVRRVQLRHSGESRNPFSPSLFAAEAGSHLLI
jgi:hypothetical protein